MGDQDFVAGEASCTGTVSLEERGPSSLMCVEVHIFSAGYSDPNSFWWGVKVSNAAALKALDE